MIRGSERRRQRSGTRFAGTPGGRTVVGVLFCGGASRRMGRDKAGLDVGGRTLLEAGVATLARLTPRVVLACGDRTRYADAGLERVPDRRVGVGPLAGLEAALEALSAGVDEGGAAGEPAGAHLWLLALACDMPRARAEVLERLLARAEADDLDACLLATPAGPEPLFAVYRGTCLAAVRAALDAGERRLVAFHGRPGSRGALAVALVPAAELGADDCARNVNTPEELAAERLRWSRP